MFFHHLWESITDFWILHSDMVIGHALFFIWSLCVVAAVRLWDGHFMWKRIEAKMPPHVMAELETLRISNAEKDKMIERQSTLIQKLSQDRRSAEALGRAIGEAVSAEVKDS